MAKRIIDVGQNETKVVYDIVFGEHKESSVILSLNGSGAKGRIYGIFIGKNSDECKIWHEVVHNAPDTKSEILVKGILEGGAKASYDSLIKMNEGVRGAEGHQKEDTLLLSKKAKINSVPHLEISHNDVKCSHSVSTTNVDKDKLFFMNSRGIKTEAAIHELVLGHVAPVLDKIDDEDVKQQVLSLLRP